MPVYRSHNVQAISFYRPDTGEVAQFDLIVGTSFEVVSTPIKQAVQGGKRVPVMDRVTLKVTLIDNGLREQLLSWARNHVGVRAVAVGTPNLQWYETGYLRITQENKRNDGLWAFTVELEADQVFGQKTIHMNRNLLAYLGWQDANANGLADGWTKQNGDEPVTFIGNLQSYDSPGNSRGVYASIVFPISSASLSFSVDITKIRTDSTLIQSHRDYSGTELSTVSINIIGTPAIKSNNLLSPNQCFSVRAGFSGTSVADGLQTFRNPALTTDGSLTPGTSFMSW